MGARAVDPLHHGFPFRKIRLRHIQVQFPADHGREMRFLQHQWRLIQVRQCNILDHTIRPDIAEQSNLVKDGFFQRSVATQYDDIRVDAHPLQLLHRMLRGLGLMFIGPA